MLGSLVMGWEIQVLEDGWMGSLGNSAALEAEMVANWRDLAVAVDQKVDTVVVVAEAHQEGTKVPMALLGKMVALVSRAVLAFPVATDTMDMVDETAAAEPKAAAGTTVQSVELGVMVLEDVAGAAAVVRRHTLVAVEARRSLADKQGLT